MIDERSELKKQLIRYGACVVFGLALVFMILGFNHYWSLESAQDRMRILCDAVTLPGVLLMLIAALFFVRNAGAFDGISYGLKTAKEILLPFLPSDYVKYQDFVAKRKEKKAKNYAFIFYTGLAFVAVGIVLIIRFNSLYPDA